MGYQSPHTTFTKHNRDLLEGVGLLNRTLINKSGKGVRRTIEWIQISRRVLGNKENYKECDYFVDGEEATTIIKVFIAEKCGDPPVQFSTSGHQQGEEGVLHFGFVFKEDDPNVKAIYFVIHPNSWGPYQYRFRTTALLGMLTSITGTGASVGASAMAGAFIGSVVPVLGTAVGGIIGGAAGFAAQYATPALVGDYLRFIG